MPRIRTVIGTGVAASLAGASALAGGGLPAVDHVVPLVARPGSTFSVALVARFDTTGAGAGVFGFPGLYMFLGDSVGVGPGVASGVAINPLLNSAVLPGNLPGDASVRGFGASRGVQPAIPGGPVTLATYDVTVAPGATPGDTIGFAYAGDLVLDQNGSLVTYSTQPGVNQNGLSTPASFVLIVQGCNLADIAPAFGTLNVNDIIDFVNGFNGMNPIADVSPPGGDGQFNVNDVIDFVNAFNAGCP